MPSRFEFERAIRHSELPAPARHVALTIATWADVKTGRIPVRHTPSLSTLALSTGLDRSTVRRHLNRLEEEEWMQRDRPEVSAARAKKARTQYRLRVPKGQEAPEEARGTQPPEDPGLGAQDPQPTRGTEPLEGAELGAEDTTARGTEPLKSSYGPNTSPSSQDPSGPADEKQPREDVTRVCEHLQANVIANGEPAHRVKITKRWSDAARLLMDRDGVTEEQIHRAIDWVQANSFWRPNVRSMPKLREKYFELRERALSEQNRSRPHQTPAGASMSSQRTAERCTEHALTLPCSSCIGDITAGDDEIPRRLLAEHGPEARPDLAQRLNQNGAAA